MNSLRRKRAIACMSLVCLIGFLDQVPARGSHLTSLTAHPLREKPAHCSRVSSIVRFLHSLMQKSNLVLHKKSRKWMNGWINKCPVKGLQVASCKLVTKSTQNLRRAKRTSIVWRRWCNATLVALNDAQADESSAARTCVLDVIVFHS